MDSYETQQTETTPFTLSHISGDIKHKSLEQNINFFWKHFSSFNILFHIDMLHQSKMSCKCL